MKRRVENWKIEALHKERARISFPEYQRQPNLWSVEKKRLLIDSIFRDIDIPKLYFNQTPESTFEVVDGSQRLWSIWDFMDDQFEYKLESKLKTFSALPAAEQRTIRNYELQVTVVANASDEYLRELFVRLQLGLLLVTGEKLHAGSGEMKDFVFEKLARHAFLSDLKMPNRRYAKATLGAQIALNSFTRAKLHTFARTRYEDLAFFLTEYAHPEGQDLKVFREQTAFILQTLDSLSECFDTSIGKLTNRSYILSVYLLFEELQSTIETKKGRNAFAKFVLLLWKRLREEVDAGMDRQNRELYAFETMLSSAPGERYQIERRHTKLVEYYQYFAETGRIKGDT